MSIFNRTKIKVMERRGAEIDYLKRFGNEWFEAYGESQDKIIPPEKKKQFEEAHPRYAKLVESKQKLLIFETHS